MSPLHGTRIRVYRQQICDLTDKVISQYPIGKAYVALF